MKQKILTITFSIALLATQAQERKQWWKQNNWLHLSIAANPSEIALSPSISHHHLIGKKQRFKIGYGARFTSYFAQDIKYVTAPALLTSGTEGPHVIFTPNKEENFDSVFVANPNVNLFNLFVSFEHTLWKKLDLGFNIDVVGFSFGPSREGGYTTHRSVTDQFFDANQTMKPTVFNLLLTSDNDFGSLNSEFLLKYRVNEKFAIKAGISFLFTEYTTNNRLRLNNDRFRQKSTLIMIGASYSI